MSAVNREEDKEESVAYIEEPPSEDEEENRKKAQYSPIRSMNDMKRDRYSPIFNTDNKSSKTQGKGEVTTPDKRVVRRSPYKPRNEYYKNIPDEDINNRETESKRDYRKKIDELERKRDRENTPQRQPSMIDPRVEYQEAIDNERRAEYLKHKLEEEYLEEELREYDRRREEEKRKIRREERLRERETPKETARRMTENPDPRYDEVSDEVKVECYTIFKDKFKKLMKNYGSELEDDPLEYDEEKSLYTLHEEYHNAVRDIYADRNSSIWEFCYIGLMAAIEYIMTRYFSFPIKGFAEFQLGRMGKIRNHIHEWICQNYRYGWGSGNTRRDIKDTFALDLIIAFVVFMGIKFACEWVTMDAELVKKFSEYFEKNLTVGISKEEIESGAAKKEGKENSSSVMKLIMEGMVNSVKGNSSGVPKSKRTNTDILI